MTNVVEQSAWWNPLLTSAIFTWLGGTSTSITNVSKHRNTNFYGRPEEDKEEWLQKRGYSGRFQTSRSNRIFVAFRFNCVEMVQQFDWFTYLT